MASYSPGYFRKDRVYIGFHINMSKIDPNGLENDLRGCDDYPKCPVKRIGSTSKTDVGARGLYHSKYKHAAADKEAVACDTRISTFRMREELSLLGCVVWSLLEQAPD